MLKGIKETGLMGIVVASFFTIVTVVISLMLNFVSVILEHTGATFGIIGLGALLVLAITGLYAYGK